MCDSKAEGGRRCIAHTVQEFLASIKSKNANVDKVTEKAENVLITAHAPQVYENKAKEKFSSGEEKVIVANRNLAHLKGLKTNSTAIKQNVTKVDYDREYLSNSEKIEYDTLKTDADKKEWFERKAKEDANAVDGAVLAWRADPNSVYDRVGIPSEHDSLLDDKKLEVDYVLAIGRNTEDPTIREKAIQHLINNHGYNRETAETAVPKNVSITLAEYQQEIEAEEEEKEELKTKQAVKAYENKLKKKEANKIKRRKAVKKFFMNLFK